jgi:hypothetical protein
VGATGPFPHSATNRGSYEAACEFLTRVSEPVACRLVGVLDFTFVIHQKYPVAHLLDYETKTRGFRGYRLGPVPLLADARKAEGKGGTEGPERNPAGHRGENREQESAKRGAAGDHEESRSGASDESGARNSGIKKQERRNRMRSLHECHPAPGTARD